VEIANFNALREFDEKSIGTRKVFMFVIFRLI